MGDESGERMIGLIVSQDRDGIFGESVKSGEPGGGGTDEGDKEPGAGGKRKRGGF